MTYRMKYFGISDFTDEMITAFQAAAEEAVEEGMAGIKARGHKSATCNAHIEVEGRYFGLLIALDLGDDEVNIVVVEQGVDEWLDNINEDIEIAKDDPDMETGWREI